MQIDRESMRVHWAPGQHRMMWLTIGGETMTALLTRYPSGRVDVTRLIHGVLLPAGSLELRPRTRWDTIARHASALLRQLDLPLEDHAR